MDENTQPPTPAPGSDPVEPRPTRSKPGRSASAESGKGKRVALTILAIVLGIVAVVFIVLAVTTLMARNEAAGKIDQATALLEGADVVVVQVDGVVRSEITSDLAEGARSAAVKIPEAQQDLSEAVRLLQEAKDGGADEDVQRSDLMIATAQARLDMLEQAEIILPFNIKASEALDPATSGWDLVLSADKRSDQAVAAYNKLTKAGVTQSRKLNKQSAEDLTKALAAFKLAEQSFPEAPFERYIEYTEERIELNKLSQQSDAAWLKGDIDKANQLIGQYNAADKRAVELAKALPATPEKAIATAYEKQAKEATDAYYTARAEATDADKSLREF